eukprot:s2774_g7.t1
MDGDPRDPRHHPSQWPCMGSHSPSKEMSNKYGVWVNCLQCGVRMWYKPRVGSPANPMAAMNSSNVKKALDELQGLLPPQTMPTEGGGRRATQDHADGFREDEEEEYGEDHQGQGGRSQSKRVRFTSAAPSNSTSGSWPFSGLKRLATSLTQPHGHQHGLRAPHSGGEGAPDAAGNGASSSARFPCEHQLGHGAGACLRGDTPVKDATFKMPFRIGKGVMMMAAALCDQLHSEIGRVIYDRPPMLWELFCSPDSDLTNQALQAGLCAYRINLAGGFDLYRKDTYDGLHQLRRRHKPKKYWISTPCTYCDWTDFNYHNRREVLFARRRKEKSMHLKVMDFAEQALLEDEEADLYGEWPRRCRAWKEEHVTMATIIKLIYVLDYLMATSLWRTMTSFLTMRWFLLMANLLNKIDEPGKPSWIVFIDKLDIPLLATWRG